MFSKNLLLACCAATLMFVPAVAAPDTPADGFIVVDANGGVARASQGYGVFKFGTGAYEVSYTSSLHNCAYSITAGSSDNTVPPESFATIVGRRENQLVLEVQTFDSTGQPADEGFHLIVRC